MDTFDQNKQTFDPNVGLIDSHVHQSHEQEKRMFPDQYSSDNIDPDIETDNVQIKNNIDCNDIPQQTASVQVNDNYSRITEQLLNTKQRDAHKYWYVLSQFLSQERLLFLLVIIAATAGAGPSEKLHYLTLVIPKSSFLWIIRNKTKINESLNVRL